MPANKTRANRDMPLAYDNPDDKCWFNSLMVILNVFSPFMDMLKSTENPGPITEMLREHFESPIKLRGKQHTVDTGKTIRRLRQAIDEHRNIYEPTNAKTSPGKALLHMLNNTGYHDPGEAWNLLYELLRRELEIGKNNSRIGIRADQVLTCTHCNRSRMCGEQEQYIHHAIPLGSLTTSSKPSIQAAILDFFSLETNVQARCCRGDEDVRHEKLYECQSGSDGVVFYGPFDPKVLRKYSKTRFLLDDEIRLPLHGHSSGVQSSYALTAIAGRYINAAHYVAIIYDRKGNPWTYNDSFISKGLPEEPWIPVLSLYEMWERSVLADKISFPALDTSSLLSTQDQRLSGQSCARMSSNISSQKGRGSRKPDFYRPEHSQRSKKKKQVTQTQDRTTRQTTGGEAEHRFRLERTRSVADAPSATPDLGPEIPTIGTNSLATQQPQNSGSEADDENQQGRTQQQANELAEKYPPNTWVWVKKDAAYLAARVARVVSSQTFSIQWAYNSQMQKVRTKRILRGLELREERIVFGFQYDQGRKLSLAKVEDLLKSRGRVPTQQLQSPTQDTEDEDGDSYSGVVFTEATVNWDSIAFPWLLHPDSGFDPTALLGLPFQLPSTVPNECFSANQEFTAHPSFCNCVKEIALVMQQLKPTCRLHQLLCAWIHLLPILLLRAPDSCSPKALSNLVSKRCTQLLQGQWETLWSQARQDALKMSTRATKQLAPDAEPGSSKNKVRQATKCIRRGNLSKGARILTGVGVSKDPNAYDELVQKHPQNVPAALFPPDYTPPEIPESSEDLYNYAITLANLARVAGTFPAESHPDQWGWRPREYIAPMLHDPGVGDLAVQIFIQPHLQGKLPELYAENFRGGRLIALSKAPKPGVRPIAIGDAFRRLLDKALQPVSKKELAQMFETTYHNVKQFASGSKDGAEKFIVTCLLALLEDPAPMEPPSTLDDDPMALLLLDNVNAFNELRRQVVIDMITRRFEGTYAQGRLSKDNTTVLPAAFAAHIPSIRAHYEGDGKLVFVDFTGQAHHITSRTGTQQGCVLGGKLFNIGTFSVIGATMADHSDVYCSMFSDNIALVGRLSKIFKAAEDLRRSLLEIDLRLQPAESAVYIPSYNKQDEPPQIFQELREQYPEFSNIPWAREGITLLGCPIGTDEYTQSGLEKVCNRIEQCSQDFSVVGDGLIHLQLHKFSVNMMLPYFLRTTNPALSTPHAQRVDALIWKALLDFSDVAPIDREDPALHGIFDDARRQVALRIGDGGFGITPNECVATPAYYSAVSRALRFAATCGFAPIMGYLTSAAFQANPLCVTYVKARSDLIMWGAKEPEPQGPDQQEPNASPAGDNVPSGERADAAGRTANTQQAGNKGASARKKKPIVLPTLVNIINHDGSNELHFPDQKALTRLAQTAHPAWSREAMTQEGKTRTAHLSKQTIKAHAKEGDGDTAVYLQRIGNFAEDQELHHSPLAFLAHTESLAESFPKDLFAVLLAYLLGLMVPACLQMRGTDRCEACQEPLDRFGHHRMTCHSTATFHTAHAQLAEAFADVARKSGIPFTDKGVPTHLTNHKVGDALCSLSPECRKLVLDYSVVHPRFGTPNAAGRWNHKALAGKVRGKWNNHGPQYAVLGFAFAPCIMTTYGQMDAHLLRLLYILAKKRAHLVHVHHRPLCDVEVLFGRFFAQSRARLGAAVARGMALRALGSSMLGVSKVFLKHVAPARFRDQMLSAGPHFAAGHTQWRLTLSV